jgi:hypothetical protein
MLTRDSGEILIPSADDSTLFDESDLSERCETLIDFLQSICQSPAQNLLLSTNKELFLRSLSKSGVQGSHNHNPQTYLLHLLSAPLSVPACVQDSVTAPLILYILVQQNCQLAALLYQCRAFRLSTLSSPERRLCYHALQTPSQSKSLTRVFVGTAKIVLDPVHRITRAPARRA